MRVKYLLNVFLLFIIFGCSGNNNPTSSSSTPPSQDITGTYNLSSASGSYVHKNGVTSFDNKTSITGTLILGETTWDETYVADGTIYTKSNGIYTILYSNGTTEGTIGYGYPDGAGSYTFSINGYNLYFTGSPNSTWTKVSD
ncbi:MAG: hypothetical protein IMF07_03200 [Proteobacteria bacterium]|nr:hypothetical protein [Pseudomonadota bacterium]